MNEAELKPCPFCGGRAQTTSYISYTPFRDKKYAVKCKICKSSSALLDDEEKAIKKWNRRSAT